MTADNMNEIQYITPSPANPISLHKLISFQNTLCLATAQSQILSM